MERKKDASFRHRDPENVYKDYIEVWLLLGKNLSYKRKKFAYRQCLNRQMFEQTLS